MARNDQDQAGIAMDLEKQKELESYRKRFEEALVRIEDKEDVIALQQARREIDDEFDEDAVVVQETGQSSTVAPSEKEGGDDAMSIGGQPADDQEIMP